MPRFSVKTQLLSSLLALILVCAATLARFYSYIEKGISVDELYTPLTLWIIVFTDYVLVIYLGYLKEIKKKHIASYKVITCIALFMLIVCMVWALILEYTLQH